MSGTIRSASSGRPSPPPTRSGGDRSQRFATRCAAGSGSSPLSGAEITAARGDLVELVQAHRLGPEDLEGATFTLSNLGMCAVDALSAIVNTPEAGS